MIKFYYLSSPVIDRHFRVNIHYLLLKNLDHLFSWVSQQSDLVYYH